MRPTQLHATVLAVFASFLAPFGESLHQLKGHAWGLMYAAPVQTAVCRLNLFLLKHWPLEVTVSPVALYTVALAWQCWQ
jgi:hypothetical protein